MQFGKGKIAARVKKYLLSWKIDGNFEIKQDEKMQKYGDLASESKQYLCSVHKYLQKSVCF